MSVGIGLFTALLCKWYLGRFVHRHDSISEAMRGNGASNRGRNGNVGGDDAACFEGTAQNPISDRGTESGNAYSNGSDENSGTSAILRGRSSRELLLGDHEMRSLNATSTMDATAAKDATRRGRYDSTNADLDYGHSGLHYVAK